MGEKEYWEKYYIKNKKRISEYSKKWQQENKERYSELKKKWYAENREILNKRRRDKKRKFTAGQRAEYLKKRKEERKRKIERDRLAGKPVPIPRVKIPEHEKEKSRRRRRIVRIYGLTLEDLERIKETQNWECAICGREINKDYHIDHSHKSGKVRGILCRYCNTGLGFFSDDIPTMIKAIKYLEKNG